MSAMSVRVTDVAEAPRADAPTPFTPGARSEPRAERRAQQKRARRSRRLWALLGCSILVAAFGLTVGILDVLH